VRVLLIDNHDSFTRNLEHLLATTLGSPPVLLTHGPFDPAALRGFDLICISPGPGHPDDYPGYGAVFDTGCPVLGICLGMQLLGRHFGGRVERLPDCVHGRRDRIEFNGRRLEVARYHSLHLTAIPDCFVIPARNDRGIAMAILHKHRPLLGFQFHPESFLTDQGSYFIEYACHALHID